MGRSPSSRHRDARSPAPTTPSLVAHERAREWSLRRHAAGSDETGRAAKGSADDHRLGRRVRTLASSGGSGSAVPAHSVVLAIRAEARHWRTSSAPDGWTVAMIFLGSILQVDRGGAEVGVAELALDDVQRHALASEFERMRVAQLVRSEAPLDLGATASRPSPCCAAAGRRDSRAWSRANGAAQPHRSLTTRSWDLLDQTADTALPTQRGRPLPLYGTNRAPRRHGLRRQDDRTSPKGAARRSTPGSRLARTRVHSFS